MRGLVVVGLLVAALVGLGSASALVASPDVEGTCNEVTRRDVAGRDVTRRDVTCHVSTATETPFPLYLPHLARTVGGVPTPRPTPTLPPPIIPDPYPGTICPVQGGAYICWPSARYSLSRGPGEACGSGMTPVFYLVSDSVNLELYQGRQVVLRGERVDSPSCVPLLRVTSLEVATPTP